MFCQMDGGEGRRKYRLSQPDAVIHDGNNIRVVIEIEHSDVTPVKLMGKFFVTALSPYYKYDDEALIIKDALFIQICDKYRLNEVKLEQFKAVEKQIRSFLPNENLSFSQYKLITMDSKRYSESDSKNIIGEIRRFLNF